MHEHKTTLMERARARLLRGVVPCLCLKTAASHGVARALTRPARRPQGVWKRHQQCRRSTWSGVPTLRCTRAGDKPPATHRGGGCLSAAAADGVLFRKDCAQRVAVACVTSMYRPAPRYKSSSSASAEPTACSAASASDAPAPARNLSPSDGMAATSGAPA